jgi:hypothetical protein
VGATSGASQLMYVVSGEEVFELCSEMFGRLTDEQSKDEDEGTVDMSIWTLSILEDLGCSHNIPASQKSQEKMAE